MDTNNQVNLDTIKAINAFGQKHLQINPFFIEIAGSIVGGYFLTQLFYLYTGHYNFQEFYKKDDYFYKRLLLTEWELRSQKKKLNDLGLITIRHGKGFITYYTVNLKKIIELVGDKSIFSNSSDEESSGLATRNPRGSDEESSGLYIKKRIPKRIPKKNTLLNSKDSVDKFGEPSNDIAPIGAVLEKIKNDSENKTYLFVQLSDIPNLSTQNIKKILKELEEYEIINVIDSCKKTLGLKNHKAAAYIMGCFKKIMDIKGKKCPISA